MSTDWTGPDAEVIAAELARVVLGGRGPSRPEQRMDLLGQFARMSIALTPVLRKGWAQQLQTVRQLQALVARHLAKGSE